MSKRKSNNIKDYSYKRQRIKQYSRLNSVIKLQKFWRIKKNRKLRKRIWEIVENCKRPWDNLDIEKDLSYYKFLKEENLNFIIVDLLLKTEDKLEEFEFDDFKLLLKFLELCKFDIVKLLNIRCEYYELYPVEVIIIFSQKINTLDQLKYKINYLIGKGVNLNFGKVTGGWSLFHSLFSIYFNEDLSDVVKKGTGSSDNYKEKDKLKKIVSFLIDNGVTELNLLHGSEIKGSPLDMLDFDNDNLRKTEDGKKLYEFLMEKGFKSAEKLINS